MDLEEIIKTSIAEFLDIEMHKETEGLDLASKIEIVQKRIQIKFKFKCTEFINLQEGITEVNNIDH
ncbi:hypothetical protein [Aquimarina sp. 2201CG5-10]|uniref:hypothetical protein n=1 Tax=Aquimarina callyspongiae TaxID=3098150 RepID=UPI002AB55D0B|nr:hypothetical protein [Aquimarina sp. 2201CG5-10]MDY8138169.1 hypothetical protein [Aquimarina sp. 2201CG5-10]